MYHESMTQPGLIALIGSGETTHVGGQAFEALVTHLTTPIKVSVLETPAGYELNSHSVAGRVADFLQTRLQNYTPHIQLIPARKQGTPFSPNNPDILTFMLESDLFVAGAGSPSYAVRQLRESLAWEYLRARHRMGSSLAFTSAAAIAIGSLALPVYEIFKVGEDPHWKPGLDLLQPFGLSVVVIPHWNNSDGGVGLDTSHCYIGAERYERLRARLPQGTRLLGIDEHTCLIVDLAVETCRVMGRGLIHLYCDGEECAYKAGESLNVSVLGDYVPLRDAANGIDPRVWQTVQTAANALAHGQKTAQAIPPEVDALIARRQAARAQRRWQEADHLRDQLAALGWTVKDSPAGPTVEPIS